MKHRVSNQDLALLLDEADADDDALDPQAFNKVAKLDRKRIEEQRLAKQVIRGYVDDIAPKKRKAA